jgi:hypothetical protein
MAYNAPLNPFMLWWNHLVSNKTMQYDNFLVFMPSFFLFLTKDLNISLIKENEHRALTSQAQNSTKS